MNSPASKTTTIVDTISRALPNCSRNSSKALSSHRPDLCAPDDLSVGFCILLAFWISPRAWNAPRASAPARVGGCAFGWTGHRRAGAAWMMQPGRLLTRHAIAIGKC